MSGGAETRRAGTPAEFSSGGTMGENSVRRSFFEFDLNEPVNLG